MSDRDIRIQKAYLRLKELGRTDLAEIVSEVADMENAYIARVAELMQQSEAESIAYSALSAERDRLRACVAELEAERDHAVRRADLSDEEMREACRRAVEWQDECCDRQNRVVELTSECDALSAQLRAAGEQEPVAHIDDLGHIQFNDGGKLKRGDRLYAAPAPVPQPQEARDVPQCISQHDHRAMQDDAPISFARGWNNCIAAILAAKEKR